MNIIQKPHQDTWKVLVLFIAEIAEEIRQILFMRLSFEDYDFDFDNATYEGIAESAINY